VRDFLYHRMRGVKDHVAPAEAAPSAAMAGDELAVVLREVATELRALRSELAAGKDRDA
jgi:hypothetical protein